MKIVLLKMFVSRITRDSIGIRQHEISHSIENFLLETGKISRNVSRKTFFFEKLITHHRIGFRKLYIPYFIENSMETMRKVFIFFDLSLNFLSFRIFLNWGIFFNSKYFLSLAKYQIVHLIDKFSNLKISMILLILWKIVKFVIKKLCQ